MATYYAGIHGDVTFDSVTLHTTNWSFTDEATEIETTHKSGDGFYKLITGKRKGSGSFEAKWDGDITYGSPPVIISGNRASITLNLGSGSGSDAITGTAVITSCEYTHDLDGAFTYNCSYVMDGQYLIPGEA